MIKDKDENEYFFDNSGVFVRTIAEKRLRKIFAINGNSLLKYVGRKHIMKDNNIGFAYEALKYLNLKKTIKDVHVVYGKNIYRASIDSILKLGTFKHFKKMGMEKQIFYNIDDMERVK